MHGAVDRAHAALAEHALDPVLADDGSRREAPDPVDLPASSADESSKTGRSALG